MKTDYLSNDWLDHIKDEKHLSEMIQVGIEADLINGMFENEQSIITAIKIVAEETAEEEGFDLEFSWDIDIKTSYSYKMGGAGLQLTECKVVSLFLHEKVM
jgi:hypothetical protein